MPGATAKGRPYFVMEYIEGAPITEYCDSKADDHQGSGSRYSSQSAARSSMHTKRV
jgi:hypothetical protein